MSILSYFKDSFARKKARRVLQHYGTRVDRFQLNNGETVEFANWLNPLVHSKQITQKEIDFFRKYIPSGSLCIDVGTNIGDITVPMSIAAGADGLVLGFDPNPHVFEVLVANSRLNAGKARIIPLQFAATATNKEFYFASSEASMSNGGLIEDWNDNSHGKFKLKEPIKGVNLAEYIQVNYAEWLNRLSFIKLDAEGLDYFILKTLVPLVKQHHPTIIMEVFASLPDQTRIDTYNLLREHGYTILNIGAFEADINFQPKPVNAAHEMPKEGMTENILAFYK
jgi:FkbM family methyltransferase